MSGVGHCALGLVPWKTSDVVFGIVLVVVGFAITVVLAAMANPGVALGLTIIGGVGGGIILLTSWIIGPVKHGVPVGTLGLRPPDRRGSFHLLWLPLLVVGTSLAFTALYTWLLSLVGPDKLLPPEVTEEIALEGAAVVGTFAVLVLWGPLAEEVFFRGFVLGGLRGRLGSSRALLASAFVFALFHVDPRVMVPIFVTGLLLAWLYQRTGSVWSSFTAHAVQNALALSISVWA